MAKNNVAAALERRRKAKESGTYNTGTTDAVSEALKRRQEAKEAGTYESKASAYYSYANYTKQRAENEFKKYNEWKKQQEQQYDYTGLTNDAYQSYLENVKNNADDKKVNDWLKQQKSNLEILQNKDVSGLVSQTLSFIENPENKAAYRPYMTASKQLKALGYSNEDIRTLADTYSRQQNAQKVQDMQANVDKNTGSFWGNVKESGKSIGASLAAGFGFLDDAGAWLNEKITGEYNPIDPNAGAHYYGQYRDKVRGNVLRDIEGEKQYSEEDMANLQLLQDATISGYIQEMLPYYENQENKAAWKSYTEAKKKLTELGYSDSEIYSLLKTADLDGVSPMRKALGEVYNAGMTMGDSLAAMGTGGAGAKAMGLGTAAAKGIAQGIQSLSAAEGTSRDVFQRTGSSGQAVATGALAGGIEAATERFSMDNLWDIMKGSGKAITRSTVANLLAQAGIEGSEEMVAEVANTLTDKLINKEDSNYDLTVEQYRNQGMSEEEANRKAIQDTIGQVLEAGAMGALAGGMSGGVAVASNTLGKYAAGYDTTHSEYGAYDMVEKAKSYSDTRVQKALKDYEESPNSYKAGKLLYEMNAVDEINRNLAQKEEKANQGSFIQRMLKNRKEGQNSKAQTGSEGDLTEQTRSKDNAQQVAVNVEEVKGRMQKAASAEELVGIMREVEANGTQEQIADVRSYSEMRGAQMVVNGITTNEELALANMQLTEQEAYEAGARNEKVMPEQLSLNGRIAYNEGQQAYTIEQARKNTITNKTEVLNAQAVDNSGNIVEIGGIVSADGEPAVQTKSGNVKLSEVNFQNAAIGTLYNNASAMGNTKAAKAYLKHYPGDMMVNAYEEMVQSLLKDGELGLSLDKVLKRRKAAVHWIGEDGVREMYALGREKAETKNRQLTSVKKKGKGKAVDKRRSKTDEPLLKVFDKIAERTGIDIEISDSEITDVRGYFEESMSRIVLNVDHNMYETVMHELGEFTDSWNTEGMKEFQTALLDWYFETYDNKKMHNLITATQKIYKEQEGSKAYREAANEIVNDAISGLFSTEAGMQEFTEWLGKNRTEAESKNILQTIADFLKDLCDAIRTYISGSHVSSTTRSTMEMCEEQAKELRKQFLKAMDKAVENYQKAEVEIIENKSKRYSLNEFGFEEYTEREVKNFSNGRTFFAKNEQDIADYVNEYVHKKPYSRILIGKIGKELADRIYMDTEIDLTNYNVAITSEFENSHTNEQKERSRGQVPITPEIVAKLPELISGYDSVSYEGYNKQQQKVLKFEKDINGKKIAIEYVSKGRKTIDLQTMYGWENKKEKNSHQASNANAHDRTSKTDLDMSSSIDSISENGENTTKRFSFAGLDALTADNNARIATEDFTYESLVAKQDVEIHHINEFDFDNLAYSEDLTRADVVKTAKRNIAKYNQGNVEYGDKYLYNRDIGKVVINNEGLRHGLRRFRKSEQVKDLIDATIYLPVYFENAVLLNEADGGRNNADKTYILFGVFRNDKGTHTTRLLVNAYDNRLEELEILYGINTKKEDAANKAASDQFPITSSKLKVSKLLEIVKKYYPNDLSKDVAEKMGYERGKSDIEGLRYSLSGTSDLDYFWESYEGTDGVLQNSASILEDGAKAMQGKDIDVNTIRRIARTMTKEYKSKFDINVFAENLEKVFSYMQDQEKANYEDMLRIMTEVAMPVIEESTHIDEVQQELYQNFKKKLRNMSIRLSDQQKNEVAHYYDSYEQFRRKMFGTLPLSESGISLDELWFEISEMSQGYLDLDITEPDQPIALVEALEQMKPQMVNNFGIDNEGVAMDLALRIYEEYFKAQNSSKMKAFEKKLTQERLDWERKQRQMYRDRLMVEKLRMKHKTGTINERVAQVRAEHRASELRKKQGHEGFEYRMKIRKTGAELIRWIERPTNQKHVPEHLKGMVLKFLDCIDFVSHRAKEDSMETVRWRERMLSIHKELQGASLAMATEKDGGEQLRNFLATLHPEFLPRLETFIENNKGVEKLSQMDNKQLKELDFLMRTMKTAVTKANELHQNEQFRYAAEAGENTIEELRKRKQRKAKSDIGEVATRTFSLDMAEAKTYCQRLGKGALSIYQELRQGFNKRVELLRQAKEFTEKILKDISKEELDKWIGDNAEVHTVDTRDGKIRLSTGQIMSLYLLSKRNQGRIHILKGGIIATEIGKGSKRILQNLPAHVNQMQLAKIINILTPEQKALADKLQSFLAKDCANWGNEVHMEMYEYKKFMDAMYFPIKTYSNQLRAKGSAPEEANAYAVKNLGFTNSTTKDAPQAIWAEDVMDAFVNHVTAMATYNAYLIPLTDAMKWFNYSSVGFVDKQQYFDGVRSAIKAVYGDDANRYFLNLLLDVNGETKADSMATIPNKMAANFKKASVMGNVSVVIQQPTAYIRALNVLDAQDVLGALNGITSLKKNAAEAIEHSAIAQWKAWGFYETYMGQSMKQIITGQQTKLEAIEEKLSMGAQKADEWTWGVLWNACKREISRKRTDLLEGSEEYFKAVTERFDEVIDETQVVDTVLHKCPMLKSKGLISMEMAFQTEPMKSYNMLYRAADNMAREEDGLLKQVTKATLNKQFTRAAMAWIFSNVLNAMAASLVYAFRDDKETPFGERYMKQLIDKLQGGLNPLNMIPFVKTAISMWQGFTVKRIDTEGVSNVILSMQGVYKKITEPEKSTKTWYGIAKQFAKGLSYITGVPVYNLWRDTESFIEEFIGTDIREKETSGNLYQDLILNDTGSNTYENAYEKLTDEKGKTEEEIRAGVRSKLNSMFKAGEITETDAKSILRKWGYEDAEKILKSWKEKKEEQEE